MGLRLAGALGRFWFVRGHIREGSTWLQKTLSHPNAQSSDPRLRGIALCWAAFLSYTLGDSAQAKPLGEDALRLFMQSEDAKSKSGRALALNVLGNIERDLGSLSRARTLFEQSIALRRELREKAYLAPTLLNLAILAVEENDHEEAARLLEESIELSRQIGHVTQTARALNVLGSMRLEHGAYSEAEVVLSEGLSLSQELGDRGSAADMYESLGKLAIERGEYEGAAALLKESLKLRWQVGVRLTFGQTLVSLARLALASAQPERAARLLAASHALSEATPASPFQLIQKRDHDTAVATTCEVLSEEAFAAAWAEGQAMTIEEAIAYALE
jgi:tetratricopeptide (TPR) repeat protein